jgi:hypothetical protein
MFNDTCTVYNKYTDDKGLEKWQRTVLRGVFWDGVRGSNFRKTGIENADSVFILIPHKIKVDKSYLSPKDWINAIDKNKYWTLQLGDTIIKGNITYEVIKSSKGLEQFNECYKITKVDNKPFGGDMAHWEVGAK